MNKVIMIGNLTRDPEHNSTTGGVAVCRFTLAINRRFADANGNRVADYIPVVAWRQTAELCARYLAKGRKVAVVGQIQSRSYDARDGSKRYVTEVIADEIEFLTPVSGGTSAAPAAEQQGFVHVDDEELPF